MCPVLNKVPEQGHNPILQSCAVGEVRLRTCKAACAAERAFFLNLINSNDTILQYELLTLHWNLIQLGTLDRYHPTTLPWTKTNITE